MLLNKIDHDDHLSAVTEPDMTKKATEFWHKTYRINGRSYLSNIPFFDVTMHLPQNWAHFD